MAKKILVVDDEPDIRKVIMLRLQKTGYETFGAESGREAVDSARRIAPDLVILDFYLPDINGDEVIKRFGKDESLKEIPIILISATSRDIEGKLKASDIKGYINKPFEPEELTGMIDRILK